MATDVNQSNPRGGVWARVWSLIHGRRAPHPSIAQVMAQWAEYELLFNDMLTRFNALLARQAKAEKATLARLAAEGGTEAVVHGSEGEASVPILSAKQILRTRIAQERFGGRVEAILAAKEARNVDSGTSG